MCPPQHLRIRLHLNMIISFFGERGDSVFASPPGGTHGCPYRSGRWLQLIEAGGDARPTVSPLENQIDHASAGLRKKTLHQFPEGRWITLFLMGAQDELHLGEGLL